MSHESDFYHEEEMQTEIHQLRTRIAELQESLKCECRKNELAKKYIETLIHPV